jgi:hypothetical protein
MSWPRKAIGSSLLVYMEELSRNSTPLKMPKKLDSLISISWLEYELM